jgi:hypothetical protein
MNRYGQPPVVIGQFEVDCKEMMFYQDYPIKLAGDWHIDYEKRLQCFDNVILNCFNDFPRKYGIKRFEDSYAYVSAKKLFQSPGCSYNRPGWHCDGYGSDDVNYIWSDCQPTVFNTSNFNLSPDDTLSMQEMREQALEENNITYPDNTLLRLDQYNVHRVADVTVPGLRTFVKVSFSYNRFDLLGNARNYGLNYNWEMIPRGLQRNIPQSTKH